MSPAAFALAALLALDLTAPAPSPAPPPPRSTGQTALAAGAAIVPGLVLHGSGHFVAGERRTAARLLALEGIAVGVTVPAILGLSTSGAARLVSAPLIAMTVGGVGLFAISGLADLYGVLAPAGGTGAPLRTTPWIEAEAGFRYVRDPTAAYSAFSFVGADLRWRRWRLAPSAWVALDDETTRVRTLGAFRFIGPRTAGAPGAEVRDGSFLELVGGYTFQRFGAAAFDARTAELSVQGRVDLGRLAPSLVGSFAEGGVGAGLITYRYANGVEDPDEVLLARFGYGIYMGHDLRRWGELMFYYDHRHDELAGGLKMRGLASGAAGHFGLVGTMYLTPSWGLRADVQSGAAHVAGLSIVLRQGAGL